MRVIIYGLGRRYYNLFDWHEYVDLGMIKNEIEVVGLSDGNPELWGRRIQYNGNPLPVKTIKEYSENDYDGIMVTSKDFYEEIRRDLVQQGCTGEKICLIDDFFEPYLELISSEKHTLLLEQWTELRESENEAAFFLRAGKYRDVAVYGSGPLAEHFMGICRQAGIRLCYLIEGETKGQGSGLPVYKAGDRLPEADIIVVATTENYMQIEKEICRNNHIEVISIQEMTYKTLKNVKKES